MDAISGHNYYFICIILENARVGGAFAKTCLEIARTDLIFGQTGVGFASKCRVIDEWGVKMLSDLRLGTLHHFIEMPLQ